MKKLFLIMSLMFFTVDALAQAGGGNMNPGQTNYGNPTGVPGSTLNNNPTTPNSPNPPTSTTTTIDSNKRARDSRRPTTDGRLNPYGSGSGSYNSSNPNQ